MSTRIKIIGTAKHVSKEQLRAFIHATAILLSYHNQDQPWKIIVELYPKLNEFMSIHGEQVGDCVNYPITVNITGETRASTKKMKYAVIRLLRSLEPEVMLTTCVHEVIHAFMTFPPDTSEACTTRLCAKIKPDVNQIAKILLNNTYKRAAYIAHTKISYVAKDGDFYDAAQNAKIGVKTKYKRSMT
ncbi:MAG: hypothetical protein DVB25_07550 [Verrucomicrobia bacterium]|jgi:hypothetical protein|nr:MAG: hypothetical protein DVB25_07550 [Verrucomicrobiota bacterium]